ncbi:DUF4417 domain-containing protein [Clostridium akagii]|uniref:DUF4417 domain-containing protein n=1 Tax=Clostridium akagii TaxID=91623 RepID=UPI00069188B3|nr:DUF4417 domain-containing protein [Clostridium akagii]
MNGLCNKRCSKCVEKGTCGGCSLCEASICNKGCSKCMVLCAKRPESIPYINSIGGTGIVLKNNREIKLSSYHIPVLPDRMINIPKYEMMPIIALHGGNMFAKNGEKINKSYLEKGYCKALNIDTRTEAIVEFYVKDRTLEGFWDKRKVIYDELKKMNVKAVITPNFSVYEDVPRIDHLYNIKRSSVVYNEMIDEGINAIPDIVWFTKEDLDRWIEAIGKSNIKTIAFSFQVVGVQLKASNIWQSYLTGFRYICKKINKDIKIITIGVSSTQRIEEIFKAANGHEIYVLNQARGVISEARLSDTTTSRDDLLEKNIIYFNEFYAKMNEIYRREGEVKVCQNPEEIIH